MSEVQAKAGQVAEAGPANGGASRKKRIGILLAAAVLAVIAAVIGFMVYRSTHITTDDAYITGDIYAISSQVSGKVLTVTVIDNQRVKAGELLVQLDPKDYEAELVTAMANLDLVTAQVAGQKASIEVVTSQIAALEAQRELAELDKNRFEDLLQKKAVAQVEYDRALAQWKALVAQIEAAQNQSKQIETALGSPDESGVYPAVRVAADQVARVKLSLEHTRIVAPIDGFVTRKNVTVGQVVSAGQPLLSVVPLSGLWIVANYKETDLTRVRSGQKVTFKVDSYPGVLFEGAVESIMAGTGAAFSLLPPENATGNYIKVVQRIPVRIKILTPNTDAHQLRVGMSVVPVILVGGK